ncbi:hypothetical protein JCM10450v2_002189 [Rhodotorula kratochvilovae]
MEELPPPPSKLPALNKSGGPPLEPQPASLHVGGLITASSGFSERRKIKEEGREDTLTHVENQGYLPTPSPAASTGPLPPMTTIQDDEMLENESNVDSLSSADTDIADKVTSFSSLVKQRRTVLFPPETTFSSADDFFDSCNNRLVDCYNTKTHRHNCDTHALLATCARRKTKKCKFQIGVGLEDGKWVIKMEAPSTRWESHGPGDTAPPSTPRGRKRKRRPVQTALRTGPASSGEEDDEEEAEEDGDSAGTAEPKEDAERELWRQSASSHPIPVPGLPRSTDTFSSAKAAYQAFVAAIVPVYGISLSKNESRCSAQIRCNRWHPSHSTSPGGVCPFFVELRKDADSSRWMIDARASTLKHSHGPALEILGDPEWRPQVYNADARAALGMSPRKGVAGKERKEGRKREEGKEVEGRRVETSPAKLKPSPTAATAAKNPRAAPAAKSFFAPAQLPSTHAQHQPAASTSRPSLAGALGRESFASPSARTNAAPHVASASPAPSAPATPSTTVSAFLRGLHPSLEPLAPHLLAAGFDSPSALASLVLLDPPILDLTLDLVRLAAESPRARPTGTRGAVSVIQLKLLARLLKEAGEEARAPGG